MELKIKLLGDAVLPDYAHDGDSGFDLRAAEDVLIFPGQRLKISTGLCFGIPEGFEIQVRGRSGIGSKTKLMVIPGTVDQPYTGEVMVTVDNTSSYSPGSESHCFFINGTYTKGLFKGLPYMDGFAVPHGIYLIKKGDRIAQAVLAPVAKVTKFSKVDELEKTVRGENGHGSSGIN